MPLRRSLDFLARYLRPLRNRVWLLAALILFSIVLQVVSPQVMRFFVDTVVFGGYFLQLPVVATLLVLTALLFLLVSLLVQGVGVAATYVGEDIGWRATNQLRADLTEHCLQLDMSFHDAHTPGEMIERIDGDVANIATFFSQFAILIFGNLLLIVVVLGVLAHEDWRVSAALVACIAAALVGLGYVRQIAVPYWMGARAASADLVGFLEEQLSGVEDTRSSGAVAFVVRGLVRLSRVLWGKQLQSASVTSLFAVLWTVFYAVGQVVAFTSSYSLYRQGEITVGAIFLVIYYTHFVFQPLIEVTIQVQGLQQALASIARVDALYGTQSKVREPLSARPLPDGPLAVEFDDVTFGYDEATPVLQRASFYLKPGGVLGVLGRTGSGKTTIARLLFRLYDPAQGVIRLGSGGALEDVREIGLDDLRRRIGMVTQNVQLFQATVRDNLTFFDASIPDDKILQVIEALGLGDWCAALPEGLDTRLGAGGCDLSAGEAQLLAFTRVFLGDPGLVILDEASSRLDRATEQLVERAVDRLFAGCTGIVIAHRLSTVRRADHIMIVEQGQIQEFGDYGDLARDPTSRFYHLLQTGLEEMLA